MRNRLATSSSDLDHSQSLYLSNSSCAVQRRQLPAEHQVIYFGPERYESRYKYPLVVWLHSCNSSELELEGVMPALSLQNYVGTAPRAPLSSKRGSGRFYWGQSVTAVAVAEEIIFESISSASQHFSIDTNRVFLAGFGSGATMAARVALRYPESFAGAIAICGAFPNEQFALSKIHSARHLPLFWLYGEHSKAHGIQHVCETLPVLHAAGLTLDIRQYPCGDELLSNMLSDANHWMMRHVTSQPICETPADSSAFSVN